MGAGVQATLGVKEAVVMARAAGTRVRPTDSPTESRWRALVAFFALAYAVSWAWAIPFAVSR